MVQIETGSVALTDLDNIAEIVAVADWFVIAVDSSQTFASFASFDPYSLANLLF